MDSRTWLVLFGCTLLPFSDCQGFIIPPSPPPRSMSADGHTTQPPAPPPVEVYLRQRLTQQQFDDAGDASTAAVGRTMLTPPPVDEYRRFLAESQQLSGNTNRDVDVTEAPVPETSATTLTAVTSMTLVTPVAPVNLRPAHEEWELPTGYRRDRLGDLHDPTLFANIVYDFHHGPNGLTALRDDDLQVCFITRFTRPFVVPRPQRIYYTHTLPGTLAASEHDKRAFRQLVGTPIYAMCHDIRVYWLDAHLLHLYTAAITANNSATLDSLNVRGAATVDDERARSPPPVSLYHALRLQQQLFQTFGFAGELGAAPPPLNSPHS